MIKGIIYDLDGTIVSSENLHRKAWEFAGNKLGVLIDDEFMKKQRGAPENVGAEILFKNDKIKVDELIKYKYEYISSHFNEVKMFEGFVETAEKLIANDIKVWICTSVSKKFTDLIFEKFNELKFLENSTVYREQYKLGKPNPEPLLLTMKHMDITSEESIYVGDAYNDYLATNNAKSEFVYFCPNLDEWDNRISNETLSIQKHSEVVNYVKIR